MSVEATTAELELPGQVSATGLDLAPGLEFDEWERVGGLLGRIGRSYQWWVGDWLNYGEREYGEGYAQGMDATGLAYDTLNGCRWVAQEVEIVRRRTNLSFSHHKEVAHLPPGDQTRWLDRAVVNEWSVRDLRRAIRAPVELDPPAPAVGEFSTIVIDPPWPMEKIERDVRPNQVAHLDYRPMAEDELRAIELPAAEDAHLYLWTTHKFLPLALELAEAWGFKYQCVLTWVKNVGFTPFSWMYSTELCLFCRRGGLDLLERGRRLDFEAKVREHSRKPDEFYNLVREVSPEPRIDMFSRERRDGFETWGNEDGKFDH
jgi:N6-adenosine-specific RNA methylase IME4